MTFKILWMALTSANPWEIAALALGVMLFAGACFGAGYATGVQSTVKTVAREAIAAPARAASEQRKADADERRREAIAAPAKKKRDQGVDDRVAVAVDGVGKSDCIIPKADIDFLNQVNP